LFILVRVGDTANSVGKQRRFPSSPVNRRQPRSCFRRADRKLAVRADRARRGVASADLFLLHDQPNDDAEREWQQERVGDVGVREQTPKPLALALVGVRGPMIFRPSAGIFRERRCSPPGCRAGPMAEGGIAITSWIPPSTAPRSPYGVVKPSRRISTWSA
jgi:hypothetical protein